jgi:hypothetical protein
MGRTLPNPPPVITRSAARAWIVAHQEQSPLFSLLPAELLARIGLLVEGTDRLCFRAACRAFRDLLGAGTRTKRSAMLRTPALSAWAWDQPMFRSAAFPLAEQGLLCTLAARAGSADTLAWLHEHGCVSDSATCAMAARGGHLEALQWAHAHACKWTSTTCSAAARGGHLEVLQWAREHGCEWDKETCSGAAGGGHLELLQRGASAQLRVGRGDVL